MSEYEERKQNFIERGLDEESASSQVYSLILPKLQKDLERIYLERLFWMRQLRKNRIHTYVEGQFGFKDGGQVIVPV